MKEPEYYEKIGYEDHGYVSPELSSSDTYPDYIEEEVKSAVRRIQSHQGADTITFGFMTDIHYALSYNHEIRMKRTVNAYREIAKRVHIDRLMLGGDYTNEGCKEHKSDCYRELRAQLAGIDYFPVNGNHDDGTIWDRAYLKKEQAINHLTHDDLYTLFYNHLPSLGAEFDKNNHALYYMYNDTVSKTRYICLDSGDVPYTMNEKGGIIHGGQWLFCMMQNQIDWLVNEALKFDEDGWSVMFFAHSYARSIDDEYRKPMAVLNDIIKAFRNGEDFKHDCDDEFFEKHIDVKFSEYTKADVIGSFIGDYHTDAVDYNDGIPYILTANAVMYCTPESFYVQRSDGNKTELLFDVVTINKNERTIYVTRVGAGEDRVIKY